MTAAEFSQWMRSRGLDPGKRASQVEAATLLAASQGEVSAWKSGKRTVPRRVARIIELLSDSGCQWSAMPCAEPVVGTFIGAFSGRKRLCAKHSTALVGTRLVDGG